MADPDSPLGLCLRYRDAFFASDVDALMALVTPDFVFENVTAGVGMGGGIDLIEVRDGRICRNADYSSAHAARVLDQPA
jgi:ketosteroid isomerase-like protein